MDKLEAVLFPDTKIKLISRMHKKAPCPSCGRVCRRRSRGERQLRDLGLTHPVVLEVHYSKHYCSSCEQYFNAPMEDLAEPGSLFTSEVKKKALATVLQDRVPLRKAVDRMLRDFYVHVPLSTLQAWVSSAGEKNLPEDGV
jgi:transposase